MTEGYSIEANPDLLRPPTAGNLKAAAKVGKTPELWLELLWHARRHGYATGRVSSYAIGIVYAVIGLLAAQAARGEGGATTDQEGALTWIVQAPFGRFLLAAITIGMAGYAVWWFVQVGRWLLLPVALGLIAYGAFMLIQARFGRMVLR